MPHLVYCGRLWRFSSDELSLPSVCAAIWRIIWTAILCSIFVLADNNLKNCNQRWIILLYLAFSIFISILSIICEVCLAHISLQGTIVDHKPRNQILHYLTTHIIFIICQLLCAIFGIYVVNYNTLPCVKDFKTEIVLALLYVTIITQLIDISGLVCCWTIFSSRSVSLEDDFENDIHLTRQASFSGQYPNLEANDKWSTRCKYLCKSIQCCTCNLIGGSGVREDLDAVGAVLSDFFHHEGFLDVVPSDVVAGILLLQFQQRAKMLAERELQIEHLKKKLIARNTGTPRSVSNGAVPRSYNKYPPKVAAAVQSVAEALDGCIPADEKFEDFMTRTKTQYLTALEILNQENFNIDLPPLESEDTEDGRSFFSPSIDYENDNLSQSVTSINGRGILNGHTGFSNKSIGTSISSKDLGSKNPSVNSLRCSDEVVESKNITPRSNIPPPSSEFPEELQGLELTITKLPTPKTSPHYIPLPMNRELDQEVSLSDVEAELGDEFDEEALPLSFKEPFDPRVSRTELKHCIATNFEEIEEMAHFSHYALGIYSTLMYLYMNPCSGLCQLCHFCSCVYPMGHCNPVHACIQSQKENTKISCSFQCFTNSLNEAVIGDNSCHFHEAAIRKLSHFGSAELIYAQLSNSVSETPYAVFVDFDRKAVVITIRGTLSLEDCITDAMATPESLREAGMYWSFVGEGRYAHSGMLKSAMQIRNTIRNVQRVSELLDYVSGEHPTGGEVHRGIQKDICPNIVTPLNETYHIHRLIIVGHSLGAGVASILGLLMKSEFPTLKVLTYGTPGSIFDKKTAGDVSTFMTSCVFGNDLVASLSFHSLSYLRENVLESIARSKVSKMSIMQTAMFQDDPDLDALLYTKGSEPDSKFHLMVEKYKTHMRKKLKKRGHRRLYHPGKIIHLRQIGADYDSSCCPFPFRSKPKLYAPFITHMLSFTEIMISSSMVLDHLPDNYVYHLNKLVKEWDIERKTIHRDE